MDPRSHRRGAVFKRYPPAPICSISPIWGVLADQPTTYAEACSHSRLLVSLMTFARIASRLALLPILTIGMVGCAVGTGARTAAVPGATLSGHAFGGQQPISGSTVQLYVVGTGGNGSAATPLLSPAIVTDSRGNFDLTGKYHCNNSTDLVYLVATGGNPGLADGTNNSKIALMSALGACGSLPGVSYLTVNELTTAAAVFSLSPFMASPASVGTSSDDTALRAAFATAQSAVSITTGAAQGSIASKEQVDTIANILASCVNSSGATTACNNLKQYTGNSADVATAALYMATSPTSNVPQLFANELPNSPFTPHLDSAPPQWTIQSLPAAAIPEVTAVIGASAATVTITTSTSDAVIHYTLDNSTPTGTSLTYTAPFAISNSAVVKAIASSASTSYSDVGSRTVILGALQGHIFAPGVTGTVRTYISRSFFTGNDCAGSLPYTDFPNHLLSFIATSTGVAYQTDSYDTSGVGGNQVVCNASGTTLNLAGKYNAAGCTLGNGYSCISSGQRTDLTKTLYSVGGNKGYVTLADIAFGYVLGPDGSSYSVYRGSGYSSISLNGTAGAATGMKVDGVTLSDIASFTIDSTGAAYWVDQENYHVFKLTQAGVISIVAGSGDPASSGDGGSPLFAGMSPAGVAVDGNGIVYILDAFGPNGQNTVRRIKNGVIYSIAGGGTTAVPGNGDAVPMNGAAFAGRAFSVNSAGTSVYVSDSDNIYQITVSQ